jgi:phage terminase large subunit-like protein
MSSTASSPRAEQFADFCKLVGLKLEPFQKRIVADLYSERREALVLIPRGNGKTTLLAALALWHLISRPDAKIAIGAASREQAGVLFEIAYSMASHPTIAKRVEITRREIRSAHGWLKVVSSDGPKQHGLDLTLAIVDELHAHKNDELYIALRTGLLKRPDAQLWTITTAGVGEYSALGQLRARARKLKIERDGYLTRAIGPHLAMLEWALPEDADIDDMGLVKAVNPASWLTEESLGEQREAVHDIAFRRYHANQWVSSEAPWISADVWDANDGEPQMLASLETTIGVDASIRRDATAVATVQRHPDGTYHATFKVWEPSKGRDVQLEQVEAHIREQAQLYNVTGVTFDPQFFHRSAQTLDDEGIPMVEWRQDNSRMCPATHTLHEAVTSGKLHHGGHPVVRQHALNAGVKETERGLRIKKTSSSGPDDAIVALAMAVEWASRQTEVKRSRYSESDASLLIA